MVQLYADIILNVNKNGSRNTVVQILNVMHTVMLKGAEKIHVDIRNVLNLLMISMIITLVTNYANTIYKEWIWQNNWKNNNCYKCMMI